MRSGSSYLSRILSAHSKISMSYDTLNFFRFGFNRYGKLSETDNFRQLIADFSYRLGHRFDIKINVDECLEQSVGSELTYRLAYDLLLRQIFPNINKTHLGDQESLVWTRIPEYLEMYPNGKVIVIARDPRDVVNSFRKITIAPGNDYLIALFNAIDIVDKGKKFSKLFPDNVFFLTFENLKLNTSEEIEKLVSFLGLDFEENMLNKEMYTDHFGNKWDDTKSRSRPEEKDPLAAVMRWKKKIDPVDLFLCEWLAREQIENLGLELSGKAVSKETFDEGLNRIQSSDLLKDAFQNLICFKEGAEKFPLDPLNPNNWDPNGVKNKSAFSVQK